MRMAELTLSPGPLLPGTDLHPQYRTLSNIDLISLEGDPVRQSSMNHPIGLRLCGVQVYL